MGLTRGEWIALLAGVVVLALVAQPFRLLWREWKADQVRAAAQKSAPADTQSPDTAGDRDAAAGKDTAVDKDAGRDADRPPS